MTDYIFRYIVHISPGVHVRGPFDRFTEAISSTKTGIQSTYLEFILVYYVFEVLCVSCARVLWHVQCLSTVNICRLLGAATKPRLAILMFLFLMSPAHCQNNMFVQPVSVKCKNKNNWTSCRADACLFSIYFLFFRCNVYLELKKKKKFVPLGNISSTRKLVLIKEKGKIACVFSKQLSFPASPMPP